MNVGVYSFVSLLGHTDRKVIPIEKSYR